MIGWVIGLTTLENSFTQIWLPLNLTDHSAILCGTSGASLIRIRSYQSALSMHSNPCTEPAVLTVALMLWVLYTTLCRLLRWVW